MKMNGLTTPQRFVRVFKNYTRLSLQIRSAATIILSTNQGEATDPNDGVQITQAGSGSNNPPYDFWWKGELWYTASVQNTAFILLVIEGNNSPNVGGFGF